MNDIPNAPVNVGEVLAGKYRVDRLLGQGAMGVVVAATNLGLGQRVALKFLLPNRAAQKGLHERFLREARMAANLTSQHVTRVSDVGTLDSGAPYMVMELLAGSDLDAVLQQRGRLPVSEAVEYVLQALEAVGEAHRAGIVHRDLKPANLFLTSHTDGSPCVKVLDFGVSKIAGSGSDLKLTSEGQAIGSPLFMSPEQMQGKGDVDARSDVWALGVILYELVAGATPFDAQTMRGLETNVLVMPPTPLSNYLPDPPPGFEAVILGCLDKQRDRRPNVAELAAALVPYAPPHAVPYAERVAKVLGVSVAPSRPAEALSLERARMRASEPAANLPASLLAVATSTGATSQPAGVPVGRRKGPIAVVVAALVVLTLGGAATVRWRAGAASMPSAVAPGPSVAPAAVAAASSPSTAPPSLGPSVEPAPEPTATALASATRVGAAPAPTQKGAAPARAPVTRDPAPTPPASPNLYGGRK